MLGTELTLLAVAKIAGLLALAGLVYAALRLGRSHRRDKEQAAELDNRHRNLFRPGVSDRNGDRTAELLNELREKGSPNGP